MPVETAIWKIEQDTAVPISGTSFGNESHLERVLLNDISILGLGPMLIVGSQIRTDHGGRIDILTVDSERRPTIIEIKRDRTPRDVVAQALDYGAWAQDLTVDRLAEIYEASSGSSFVERFEEMYGEDLDAGLESPRLVIVGSQLDASSERIVSYLGGLGVDINVVFFRSFEDGGTRYLTRSWLVDPVTTERRVARSRGRAAAWDGRHYYVNFGEGDHRRWNDARRYGFVSAGGGTWYSTTLRSQLKPGTRILAYIPQTGYVGIGDVLDEPVPVTEFKVDVDGNSIPFLEAPHEAPQIEEYADPADGDTLEWVARVQWVETVAAESALREKGLFANQNTVVRLRRPDTIERVYAFFGVEQE